MILHLKKLFPKLPIKTCCLLCKGYSTIDSPICQHCLNLLPVPDASCPKCGIPMPESDAILCAQCLQLPPPFDHCLSAFTYEYPASHIIQRIKYHHRIELLKPVVPFLVDVLLDHYLEQPWPEVIVPTPLHKKRIRHRGYNQSLLLAKAIQKQLSPDHPCQLAMRLVYKHKHTAPQQSLPAKSRQQNIRGAFRINTDINTDYRHVAIVDDVVTTAETVNEMSRVLKKKGVEQVDIWCLARTPSG